MGKIKFKTSVQGKSGSTSPVKGLDVKHKSAYGKIGATYTTEGGGEFTFGVGKSINKAKVDFPGGSAKFKDESEPDFFLGYKKKFKYGGIV